MSDIGNRLQRFRSKKSPPKRGDFFFLKKAPAIHHRRRVLAPGEGAMMDSGQMRKGPTAASLEVRFGWHSRGRKYLNKLGAMSFRNQWRGKGVRVPEGGTLKQPNFSSSPKRPYQGRGNPSTHRGVSSPFERITKRDFICIF